MNDYKPRQEVIDFIKNIIEHAGSDQATLFRGRKPVSGEQILQEMIEGTPNGRKSYAIAEFCYDGFQAMKGGEPLNPDRIEQMLKQYVDSNKPESPE